MKIKVSEATNVQLDWMVAKCEGYNAEALVELGKRAPGRESGWFLTPYSTDWSQGGPLLSEKGISRTTDHSGLWIAYWTDGYTDGDAGKLWMQCDKSELVAGLRCFVASRLGDEVEVPDDLA